MQDDKYHIDQCRKRIEERFNFSNEGLMERDYEYLREMLLKETKTDISTSTLRRIWSDQHQGTPQIKTLDALAQLIGFSCWHEFKHTKPQKGKKWRPNYRLAFPIAGLAIVLITTVLISASENAIGEIDFRPELEVSEGVPATIGFYYAIKDADIDIELSWNPYERTRLDPTNDYYSGTYYYPDYHQAKLLHEDQVLIQKPVYITTAGWHGLVMDEGYDKYPQYLDEADFMKEGGLVFTSESAVKLGLDLDAPLFPNFTLSNQILSQLSGDAFRLTASLRSEPFSKKQICWGYDVLLKGTNGNIRIPIIQTGCNGLSQLKCSDQVVSGKQRDLSNLEVATGDRHELEIMNRDHQLSVTINQQAPFQIHYNDDIGTLKVIKFIFNGTGELFEFAISDLDGNRLSGDALGPFSTKPL